MSPLFVALFQLGNFFADLDLILKVTGLLLLMSFVRTHVQNAMLATLITIGLAGFLLFDGWGIFGTGLVVYLAITFGVVGILVDIFFFGGIMHRDPEEVHMEKQRAQAAQQHRGMSAQEQAMLRARGIHPEEYEENMHDLQGHEDSDDEHEHEHGHGGEGVNSQEMREKLHKLHQAGKALHGNAHPPHRQAHRPRGLF
jgi:uncharacterized membrane protein